MYPDWPESDEDLIPLPECPGPKLKPFDFQGPQNIEFLEIAGEGLHAMVFKVRILGNIYALKVVSISFLTSISVKSRAEYFFPVPLGLGSQLDRPREMRRPPQSRTNERLL